MPNFANPHVSLEEKCTEGGRRISQLHVTTFRTSPSLSTVLSESILLVLVSQIRCIAVNNNTYCSGKDDLYRPYTSTPPSGKLPLHHKAFKLHDHQEKIFQHKQCGRGRVARAASPVVRAYSPSYGTSLPYKMPCTAIGLIRKDTCRPWVSLCHALQVGAVDKRR